MAVITSRRPGSDPFSSRTVSSKRRNMSRIDQDGDLVMDARPQAKDRITKARVRNSTGKDAANGPLRSSVSSTAFKREMMRHFNSTDIPPCSSRITSNRFSGPTKSHSLSTNRIFRPKQALTTPNEFVDLKITGWKSSKVASNEDGGSSALITWLERKTTDRRGAASTRGMQNRRRFKINDWRVEDDSLVVMVLPEEASLLLRFDGYGFAGSKIRISQISDRTQRSSSPRPSQENDAKRILKSFLARRYNSEAKLLDLSGFGQDSELASAGMFKTTHTQTKFFPALMTVCDAQFKSAQEKSEMIESVLLSRNDLTSITLVMSLAETFPDLKNLDLSNNILCDVAALNGWRHKFRNLDHLILTGNPLEQIPNYHLEILKWCLTLRYLNGNQIRSDNEIVQTRKMVSQTVPQICGPNFQDENRIAESFITNFFLGFDSDRDALAGLYYDSESTFSYAVNTHALRDPSLKDSRPQGWDTYIKNSRNLKHITHASARTRRLFKGPEAIRDMWKSFPVTRHPNMLTDGEKWLIECQQQLGVPDPTGSSPTGVAGFLITIHGEFEELDTLTGHPTRNRSFDRTIILGPGGRTGVRVVTDILTIRAYGGFKAWKVEEQNDLSWQNLVAELSKLTGMNEEYAKQCLEESGWLLEKALISFENAKASLPREAFAI